MPNPHAARRRAIRTNPVTLEQAPPSHLDSTLYPSGRKPRPDDEPQVIPSAETVDAVADLDDQPDDPEPTDGAHVSPVSDGDEMPVNAVDLAAWITTPERAEQALAVEEAREKPRSTVMDRIEKILGRDG